MKDLDGRQLWFSLEKSDQCLSPRLDHAGTPHPALLRRQQVVGSLDPWFSSDPLNVAPRKTRRRDDLTHDLPAARSTCTRCLLMAPIILLRLPAAAWMIHVRIRRQAIGARQGGARISGKGGVRISGTDNSDIAMVISTKPMDFMTSDPSRRTPGVTCGLDGRAPCARPFESAVSKKPSKARDRPDRQVDAVVMRSVTQFQV